MDTNYSIANFNLSVECMIDEIDDFTVEHPIFITTPNQTIANHILRAEALKFTFRDTTHGQTNTYFETVILKLSSYIIRAFVTFLTQKNQAICEKKSSKFYHFFWIKNIYNLLGN